uniref:PDZ domain-containing protein n=1 Tax=Cyprinus carpio TaxID=7962 RepID=A0A8C1IHV2_CYPCA
MLRPPLLELDDLLRTSPGLLLLQRIIFIEASIHQSSTRTASVSCRLSLLSSLSDSDYIIKEKIVLLQKKDNEGFGFVLRGAKAQTPVEEFSPTPAFPALQYLESVDEGGVAWRSGLRMGDFLIEVNGINVVKVGHRQVVNMIRQGGNSLMVKVVMVARNPEMEEIPKKKVPQQSKRLTPPAIALRSKSMTSELEEMERSVQCLVILNHYNVYCHFMGIEHIISQCFSRLFCSVIVNRFSLK